MYVMSDGRPCCVNSQAFAVVPYALILENLLIKV